MFIACVVDTGDLPLLSNISTNFVKNRNGPNGIIRCPGDTGHGKAATESEKVGQPKEKKEDLNKYRTEERIDLHSQAYHKTDQINGTPTSRPKERTDYMYSPKVKPASTDKKAGGFR